MLNRSGVVATSVLLVAAGVAFAQPANDDCNNAVNIGVGGIAGGSTSGATGVDLTECGDGDTADVWYSYTATADQTLWAITCGPGSLNSVVSIHDGCDGEVLACNDDGCGVKSIAEFDAVNGQTYLIRVAGVAGTTGTFRLELTDVPQMIQAGPDVIVGDLPSTQRWGALEGKVSFSTGTTSCNLGDEELLWIANTREHPVIGQNMYRLKDGRFEQIGQSWLKHGFLALAQSLCASCNNPNNGARLGVGCSDPYGSGLNGGQSGLGPRSKVNASNGFYQYPDPLINQSGNVLFKRCVVEQTDIETNANGARYFVEGHYVTPDDATSNNGLNNASHREIRFNSVNSAPVNVGNTVREMPAITAWAAIDNEVMLSTADYTDSGVTARFYVGSKVTDNGDGTWTYEYAVHNLNSDRSGGGFSIPVAGSSLVDNIGFHDVDYHSGEPYDNTDWTGEKQIDSVRWWSPQTYDENPNSNALRWSTLYNFRFTVNAEPTTGQATIELFKPGAGPTVVLADAFVPAAATCAADWNADGFLNDTDFFDWLNDYFSQSGPQGQYDFNADGFQNAQDWFDFTNAFFNPGPDCQ